LAFSIEKNSTHPLAKAIVNHGQNKNANTILLSEVKEFSGIGIAAKYNERNIFISSYVYAIENNLISKNLISKIDQLQNQAKTICIMSEDKTALGCIALQDTLRKEAKETLNKINNLKITSIILTGDHQNSANAVAQSLNVTTFAQLLPEQKLKYIREFSKAGKVAMVGDGINDAPALAAADVGIAMGGGTDIAIDSAQIVIANENIQTIAQAISIAKKTYFTLTQNIIIAVALKLLFLILVFMGSTTLWLAILADTGATLIVTLNSMKLLRVRG
jgi:Cd2+/Zn2+-exporting ATPase